MPVRLSRRDHAGGRTRGMRRQGDGAVAFHVTLSRFARPGKRIAKVTCRAGADQEVILARTKSANHQISFENAGGRTDQIAGKPLTGSERPGRGYAVAAIKSRWLRNAGREQGELLLIRDRMWAIERFCLPYRRTGCRQPGLPRVEGIH